ACASYFTPTSPAKGMSRAVLEAMASGCAIVSSMPGEFAGRHVPARDADALASALGELWSDQASASAYGARNCEIARRYTWDAYTDALLDVYRDVLDRHQERP